MSPKGTTDPGGILKLNRHKMSEMPCFYMVGSRLLFTGMMDKRLLRKDDPEMLAFAYTAPISALIHLCDREPEKTEDAIKQIEAFSQHFIQVYRQED